VPYDGRLVLDTDGVLQMDRLPRRLAVIGTGVMGCEYSSIFGALGIEVTMLGRHPIMPFLDAEIAARLHRQMERLGLRIRVGPSVERYEPGADSVRLVLSDGGTLEVDKVLVTAGRVSNTDRLALDRAGITPGPRGLLKVNERYQTEVSHVYAVGDVIGFPALAAVSMEQARVAVCHAFGLTYKTRVAGILPLAVYTIPEVAMAGETEETCREKGRPYCVGRAYYADNARGQISGDLGGEIKLVFAPEDQQILGVHVIGENASELIHIGMACMALEGSLDYFIQAVFNYPTLAEAYKYAAYDGLQNLARLNAGQPLAPPRPA
jgi:NAD(P) transhydrogenase